MIQKQKRWLKIIGFSILGIFVVPIILAIVLLWNYQTEIIKYVRQEVIDQYGMHTDFKKSEISILSDWPNATLLLREIDLHDTLDLFKEKPFLRAEEVSLSLNLIPLLKKEFKLHTINIKKAKVQIWVDSTGQSNVSFLKKDFSNDTSTFNNKSLSLKKLKLSDIHFIFMDEERYKAIDIKLNSFMVNLKSEKDKHLLELNGNSLVNRLAFDTEKGDFIKGKHVEMENWKGEISTDLMFFKFSEGKTIIDNHLFDLELAIKIGGEGLFALKVNTQKLDRLFALSLLTEKIQQKLARFQWTGLIDLEADIKIPLTPRHDPTLFLTAKSENSDFKLDNYSMLLVGIQGLVKVNIPGDSDFSGDLTKGTITANINKAIFKKWPITGKILIENLNYPVLTANASLNVPATMLNSGQMNGPWSGTANALLNLKLPLDDVTADNWMEHAKRCDVVLKSSDIHYKVKNKKSLRLNLLAHLNTKVLEIKKCNVTQDKQSIQVSGVVYDFMSKVLNEESHWKANVKLTSEHIVLENWLDNIKQITEALPDKKQTASSSIDKQEMDNIMFDMNVKKMSYDKFIANQIKGQLLIKPLITSKKANSKQLPLSGKTLIDNPPLPFITANSSFIIPVTVLNAGLVNSPWSGTANALLDLQLSLDGVNADNWMERAKKCDLVLKSSDIYYKVKNKQSLQLDILAHLDTKLLELKKCNVTQDKHSIQLSGVVDDFMRKIFEEENYWKADVKLISEDIALENWIDNIKQITEVQTLKIDTNNLNEAQKNQDSTPTMGKQEMDDILLEVDVKKLSFDKFTATEIKGQLLIKPELAEVKNLKLNSCKGEMQADIVWKNSRYINGNVKIKDAQVSEIFNTFNNFKQDVVKAEQLEGKINMNTNFSMEIDSTFHVYQNSLVATADLSLTDGNLRDFEPFEKISKYAFKNRNLDNIAISDLKQRFRFNGTVMQIETMEINSSALWVYVKGTYNFKGESDLRIQIPWKNLKKIPKDAIFGEQKEDGRKDKSLFLKAVGTNGNISISYDPTQGGKRKERKEDRRKERRK